jgi:DNA-binding MarR family transcriptional regulator
MIAENEIVIKQIVSGVRRLVKAVYLDSSKFSRQFGLTGPQSTVLRTLISEGAMSSAELSRRLYMTPANMTGIIDRLEKKGLVERNRQREDRRVVMLNLTAEGRQSGTSLPDPIESKFINQLADLEPEHVQLLAVALDQILNMIDTNGIEDAPLELTPARKDRP